jgi:hypothetical protein
LSLSFDLDDALRCLLLERRQHRGRDAVARSVHRATTRRMTCLPERREPLCRCAYTTRAEPKFRDDLADAVVVSRRRRATPPR